ncbi:MAG: 8-oxo-dGTP diphosphatase [Clostridia bacterium]|nr:8-oxo-dGTP diphosphatase [Clostridia bacterium]
MKLTTLCYIIKDGKWLMLHRTKKENDCNADKWIGVGGKLEKGESPENCLYREVSEETNLKIKKHRFRGVVTFISDTWDDEMMFLYTVEDFEGEMKVCDEGELSWIDENVVPTLNLWEGDRVFIDLLCKNHPFFSLKLSYKGDDLVSAELDGKAI